MVLNEFTRRSRSRDSAFFMNHPQPTMPPILRSSLCLASAAIFASCAVTPATHSSYGRDVWGHRPGPRAFTTVILDAGHGGKDSGATSPSTGQREKDLTLDMVHRLRSELRSQFTTVLMRNDDSFVDLDERVHRANEHPDAILVSVHFNSGPSNVCGPEAYYWRLDSHGLASRLQRAMVAACPTAHGNRGLVRRRLRLTRNPEIPAVLLEGGYLSNPGENRLLAQPAYRQQLAVAIAAAIRSQADHGDAGTGPLPPPLYSPPSRPGDTHE